MIMRIAFYNKGKGIVSMGINLIQSIRDNAQYSHLTHVELEIDGVWYTSSYIDGGVSSRKIIVNDDNWDFINIHISDKVKNKIRKFFLTQSGKPYDYLGILFSQTIPLSYNDKNKWFCSEIVAEALITTGIIDNKYKSSWYSPDRLADKLISTGLTMS